jgi:hypothetical protein
MYIIDSWAEERCQANIIVQTGGPMYKYYGVVKYVSYRQVGRESGEIFII